MRIDIFSVRELQSFITLLHLAEVDEVTDVSRLRSLVSEELRKKLPDGGHVIASKRRRPDNITVCPVCGGPAIIVPLSSADRTRTATHAIQCQNRPATDQPWREGMCGHTAYIVRGDK